MKLFLAPLEGITTYTYRNIHAEMFSGTDAYYSPFINPSDLEKISKKGMRDILPENDKTGRLKVQVLTSNADSFLKFCEKIRLLGYNEININVGCPASTVVKKGRGSGFLQFPDEMDKFFCDIFSKSDISISVKTRTGFSSHEEMDKLIEIYNKYPISMLTIHPRTREEQYSGCPNLDVFSKAFRSSLNKVCYNGDIRTVEEYEMIRARFPELEAVMLGRGAIQNPALFREIRGGAALRTEELIEFSKRLIENYRKVLGSDVFTLHKMKEVWIYAIRNFPEETKIAKAIKKAASIADFISAISALPSKGE